MLEGMLIVLFIILNYLDVTTTLRALDKDLKEVNPLVFKIFRKFGKKGLLSFKTISVAGFVATVFVYPFNIAVIVVLVYALIVANNVGILCRVRDKSSFD